MKHIKPSTTAQVTKGTFPGWILAEFRQSYIGFSRSQRGGNGIDAATTLKLILALHEDACHIYKIQNLYTNSVFSSHNISTLV